MEEIKRELERVVKVVFGVDTDAEVAAPAGQKMADGREVDFATNVAMKLAKEVGRAPREIAEEILNGFSLEEFTGEIAGPGFINFYAESDYFLAKLTDLADDFDGFISCDEYAGQTVICEFSDPNPFKVLHVGHLYTSIVGDAISRLFEYAGARVIRANFGGDVGLHVAKTLYAARLSSERASASAGALLTRRMLNTSRSATPASLNSISDDTPPSASEVAGTLAECYVAGTKAYEEDEKAREEITELNREIYEINAKDLHNSELSRMYWAGREASYEYFKEFYAKLGIEFDKYYPESTVAGLGVETVRKHPEVYVQSDGAVVFRGEEWGLHTRVFINKEGLPTYETKDVGLLFTKWRDFEFDKSVVITGNEQKDYMAVVLKSVEMYEPELVRRTTHLTHGMVRLPGNVKMSSRLGNFLRAVDVIELVSSSLLGSSTSTDEGLIMAALKYAFLKYKMGGDIEFDVKSSVSITGNSGIYLEYAAVRARKILERISSGSSPLASSASRSSQGADGGGHPTPTARGALVSHRARGALNSAEDAKGLEPSERALKGLEPAERALLKKMSQYRGVLYEAVEEMAPHKICGYLYELAQEFSRFYEKVQVVGSEREELRGREVQAYLSILEHGLKLLGIDTVEEM